MKYKVYPVIFIITLLGFMSIFGGITDIELSDKNGTVCPEDHYPVIFTDFTSEGNGNQAIVTQTVVYDCLLARLSDCDELCEQNLANRNHYTVTVSVLQDGVIIKTLPAEIEHRQYNRDVTIGAIKNTISFFAKGDYVLRYDVVCDGGTESTKDQAITITDGINGNFALQEMDVTCSETGKTFTFKPEHFTGVNTLFIDNTSFSMKLKMKADINAIDYPCIDIENGYEVDEAGTFTSNSQAKTATISYLDGSATVEKTFDYVYDGDNLVLTSSEVGEDAVTMTFKKQTVPLAKR